MVPLLNTWLRKIFWEPMGLTHITYKPLENGFSREDCATTELNGNLRDGYWDIPEYRDYTLQGEVHDEMAWYNMAGISGQTENRIIRCLLRNSTRQLYRLC